MRRDVILRLSLSGQCTCTTLWHVDATARSWLLENGWVCIKWEPNSWHSLAPHGCPSASGEIHRGVSLAFPPSDLSISLSLSSFISFISFAYLFPPRAPDPRTKLIDALFLSLILPRERRPWAEGSAWYGELCKSLREGFRKNGKSLRTCQSDVQGFIPLRLMMIHCSISALDRETTSASRSNDLFSPSSRTTLFVILARTLFLAFCNCSFDHTPARIFQRWLRMRCKNENNLECDDACQLSDVNFAARLNVASNN